MDSHTSQTNYENVSGILATLINFDRKLYMPINYSPVTLSINLLNIQLLDSFEFSVGLFRAFLTLS